MTVLKISSVLLLRSILLFAGLLMTALIAFVVQFNDTLLSFAGRNFFILFIAQLALVIVISGAINKLSATVALGLLFAYAASPGLTVGLIVSAYTGASVVSAFMSASAMFGGAALYGYTTKRSLALREFALGVEGLERFVRREPVRRVHECVFGVLALESEPVDPRL